MTTCLELRNVASTSTPHATKRARTILDTTDNKDEESDMLEVGGGNRCPSHEAAPPENFKSKERGTQQKKNHPTTSIHIFSQCGMNEILKFTHFRRQLGRSEKGFMCSLTVLFVLSLG
jgi:hypothetical protein